MTWRQRIEFYVAEGRAVDPERVTVSKNVFDKAQTHQLRIVRSNPDHTIGEVTSATSGSTYWTELWVDYDRFYPSFPFVWKCDCKWSRERFQPCSHVLRLALHRLEEYPNEDHGTADRPGADSLRPDMRVGATTS